MSCESAQLDLRMMRALESADSCEHISLYSKLPGTNMTVLALLQLF
jgi:hypothetical protein